MLLGGVDEHPGLVELGETVEPGPLAEVADDRDEVAVATEGEQVEVEAAVGVQVADEVVPRAAATMASAPGRRASSWSRVAVRTTLPTVGTSMSVRISVYSSRSCSVISVTRKPLFRTTSTSPSWARSSIASRTGVGETPNSAARAGAE